MSIESEHDLAGLMRVGRVVALTLQEMRRHLRPGITTAELDDLAARFLARHGAQSAPRLVYAFPGATCISLNDVAVHGIPSDRALRDDDLVTLDVTAALDGYIADSAITVPMPAAPPKAKKLAQGAQFALQRAINTARAGRPLNRVGQAVETAVHQRGFKVLRELAGHGVGRTIHEPPSVRNYFERRERGLFTSGLVVALEPIIAIGTERVREDADGWTIRTSDGSLAAHFEHTVVITDGKALVLTAA